MMMMMIMATMKKRRRKRRGITKVHSEVASQAALAKGSCAFAWKSRSSLRCTCLALLLYTSFLKLSLSCPEPACRSLFARARMGKSELSSEAPASSHLACPF